ncbi:YchJ family protein [Alteromonas sp. ASW11-130]|uniref:YchJ family protein n=1 Tax=Alteromonas sp. ASW11-130 TaxID=3015775 RepID=UPI002242ACC5|nr:YchJ family protein [Alteromonas sp. ASW11-130]MCW8092027.1 YchJ family protein [Alteromonas sp. ASW11-130]
MATDCYCNSRKNFNQCCQPLLEGKQVASTAEALMRSRYSAYCTKNYYYVLNTYVESKRADLTEDDLAETAKLTTWLYLDVIPHAGLEVDQVEFKAWYKERNTVFLLHETSRFIQEKSQWRYLDGQLHQDCGKVSIGRNDSCVCKSGKKYKQCCMRRY